MFKYILEALASIWSYFNPQSLNSILAEHGVASTASLTNYWKDYARQHQHLSEVTVSPGERIKDLYKDDYLALFYNNDTAIEARNRLPIKMWLPLATRTKYFRQTISMLIKNEDIKQVVILGAGFDTLAVRKRKYSDIYDVRFYEIDHAKILNCKAAIYQTHSIDKNAEYIGMDYTEGDFISALIQRGINIDMPILFLWEGNTFYLKKDMVLSILKRLSETFPKLIISFDFMHPQIEKEEKTIDAFAKKQSPFQTFFSPDEIRNECEKFNLSTYSHVTTDVLAQEFELDETPYHTAKPYSVTTMHSGGCRP